MILMKIGQSEKEHRGNKEDNSHSAKRKKRPKTEKAKAKTKMAVRVIPRLTARLKGSRLRLG